MKRSALLWTPIAGFVLARAAAASPALAAVAAENVWGSLVAQLGGTRIRVQSILTDPNADPHEYEASTAAARSFADAQYVVVNGAGYDAWAGHLVDGNPAPNRLVLSVAELVGALPGANAHFWYNPTFVERVADRITQDLEHLDPAGAAYYRHRRGVLRAAFVPYHARIERIRARYHGAAVGSTETIFVYLAAALGLALISPPEFMKAVADGTEPPVSAVIEMNRQIQERRVRLLAYNVQTVTSATTEARRLAAQARIPVVGISETLLPANASFQAWQIAQLDAIAGALAHEDDAASRVS